MKDMRSENAPTGVERISTFITGRLELFFEWHGARVARHPLRHICLCFLLTFVCCLGLMRFRMETKPEKLWIPQNSDFVLTKQWQASNFPDDHRMQLAIFESDNILTPAAISEMYDIAHRGVGRITVQDAEGFNKTQKDLCFSIPVVTPRVLPIIFKWFPVLQNTLSTVDWSLMVNFDRFCEVRAKFDKSCLEFSILDIWGNDHEKISSLSQQDILDDINMVKKSATYSIEIDFQKLLGGVQLNSSGHIISATTALHQWPMVINRTAMANGGQVVSGLMDGLGSDVDVALYRWEEKFVNYLQRVNQNSTGLTIYMSAERSFSEVSGGTILGDVRYLIVGNAILFIYVTLMLGRFDVVQTRPILSLLGLLSTFMSVLITFGLCAGCGLVYGPIHSILPLLMLGLGVDDMFVIVTCWSNLPVHEHQDTLEKVVSRTLRSAGVAITVTSLTDAMAFAIGATTVLPALRSFCVYAAVGVMVLYMLQSTFFVAWFTLDQRRMNENRHGLFWNIKRPDHSPSQLSKKDLLKSVLQSYCRVLFTDTGKILAASVTMGLFVFCVWSTSYLRQEFNPVWFIPQSSYLHTFLSKLIHSYPDAGSRGSVYLGELDYPAELPKIANLTKHLTLDRDVTSVNSWYSDFVHYVDMDIGEDITGHQLNETYFSSVLGRFLFSVTGSKFKQNFHFDGPLTCGEPAPKVLASKLDYQHSRINNRDDQIEAMDRLKEKVKQQHFSGFSGAIAFDYAGWETDKVIVREMVRNLSLAMAMVFATTLVLLADLRTALMVFICVAITTIEVMGLMVWWGLTVDIVSCINLVLCIGLCVDYSAHVGLHFLRVSGSLNERATKAVTEMGTAVINGASSTFLAFILLAFSDSHVFLTFFKIFFGVSVFGVLQGLVLLPVLLSVIGTPISIKANLEKQYIEEHQEKRYLEEQQEKQSLQEHQEIQSLEERQEKQSLEEHEEKQPLSLVQTID